LEHKIKHKYGKKILLMFLSLNQGQFSILTTTIFAVFDCPSLTHKGNMNVGGEKIVNLVVCGERTVIES
jgi:hypothetical protein